MAPKWSNDNLAGALHFVTGNVLDRKPIFHGEQAGITFLQTVQELRIKRESKIIAFVIMPDHFHLIVNPCDGKIREWTGALKSIAARNLNRIVPTKSLKASDGAENQIWQESFKSLPLWSTWMIWQKINYIHANPVRARLADSAKDYKWTSFRTFYFDESDVLFQIDKEWWWPDDIQKLERSMAELNKGK